MKRFLLSIPFLAAAFSAALAAPLSPEEALARASQGQPSRLRGSGSLQLTHTFTSPDEIPAVYAFSSGDGFLLVSADDAVLPLLGYSYSGSFNPAEIPSQLRFWLDGYCRQIQQLRKEGGMAPAKAPSVLPSSWQPIAPLMETTWWQSEPYFNLCPEVNGEHCVTGCVATATAQIMRYHQYPARATGYVSYSCPGLGMLSMDLAEQPLDWTNILADYSEGAYTRQQADAVAYLMKAVGYSLEMGYTVEGSATPTAKVPVALKNHFDYDSGAVMLSRENFTYSDWAAMIYDNLKTYGPVLYAGADALYTVAHAFVCDGYDGNGYFHFNFGWGGAYDGFYLLDAISPDRIAHDGYVDGFLVEQDAVFGIIPPGSGKPSFTPLGPSAPADGMLSVNSLELLSPLHYGSSATFRVSLSNNTGSQLTGRIGVVLQEPVTATLYSTVGRSDGFMVTLDPGETDEREFSAIISPMMPAVSSDVQLFAKVYDFYTGHLYAMDFLPVTMHPALPEPDPEPEPEPDPDPTPDPDPNPDVDGVYAVGPDIQPVTVYTLQGIPVMKISDPSDLLSLPKGLYIVGGKKIRL